MSRSFHLGIASLLLFSCCCATLAGDWPCWRGSGGQGISEEKDLPLHWDGKTGDGILWKTPLKNLTGHSTPIVWGDRIYITTATLQTADQEKAKQIPEHQIRCYDARDGKERWATTIQPGKMPEGYAIYAVPTPCTDGKAVYAWFGSSVAAAVGMDGKLLWRTQLEGTYLRNPYALNPGICTSPVLWKDTLIILCDQSGNAGWIQALDKASGAVKWNQKRTPSAYGNATPMLIDVKGAPQLATLNEAGLEGLDPNDGHLIWQCKCSGFGASAVFGAGLVIGMHETAVAVDPLGAGDVTKTHIRWKTDKAGGDYTSAVISGEFLFRAAKPGVIRCWKLSTGQMIFSERAEGVSTLDSPIAAADGRIYFISADKTYIIKAGPQFKVLAVNDLRGSSNGASAAVAGGRIYIRDNDNLYCIGRK